MSVMPEPDEQSAVPTKPRLESLPDDFLEPLALDARICLPEQDLAVSVNMCRQFWKAGDYEVSDTMPEPAGMDHVRVHPKFLHSNATSHKWCLGAIAELLDNAVDEIANGATYINIDVLKNPMGGAPMLLFEDDGGGMSPDRLRRCMSFGYSEKTKKANTIGQYGNGFKTSTMRLGADVIVFSRTPAGNGQKATRSVGLLSYTFLQATAQQDIIVPMIDFYEEDGKAHAILRGRMADFATNLGIILKWGPYDTERVLKDQFKKIKSHGTRILVYNLWENEEKELELDFHTDPTDIQVKGTRDESKIAMANNYPSAKHYFTYNYSLRSYASILYLRLPEEFKMTLRGKEIEHHSLKSDLIHAVSVVYRPQAIPGQQIQATVTLGFVKDAREHIDVQGFNVYHKNRLIKPFWRLWNTPSSQGRGVVGILEANFVEPAHNKQGFERTPVLQRLESRLQYMQKTYWHKYCHFVGYRGGGTKKRSKPLVEEDWEPKTSPRKKGKLDRSYGNLLVGSPSKEKETAAEFSSDEDDRNALALVSREHCGRPTRTRTPGSTLTDEEDDIPILNRRLARKTAAEAAPTAAAETSDDVGKETGNKKGPPAARILDDGDGAPAPLAPAVGEEDESEEAGSGRKSKRRAATVTAATVTAATLARERAVPARRNKKRRRKELTPSSDYSDPADEEQDDTNEQAGPAKARAFLRRLKVAGNAPEKQTTAEKPKGPEEEASHEEGELEKEVREAEVQTDEQTNDSLEKLEVENLQLRNRFASLENELRQSKATQKDLEAKQKELEAKQKELEATSASKLAMLELELEREKAKNRQLEVEIGKAEDALVRLHQDLLQGDSLYKQAVDNEEDARKRALEDEEELRRQLKNARNRVRELEAENSSLKGQ